MNAMSRSDGDVGFRLQHVRAERATAGRAVVDATVVAPARTWVSVRAIWRDGGGRLLAEVVSHDHRHDDRVWLTLPVGLQPVGRLDVQLETGRRRVRHVVSTRLPDAAGRPAEIQKKS